MTGIIAQRSKINRLTMVAFSVSNRNPSKEMSTSDLACEKRGVGLFRGSAGVLGGSGTAAGSDRPVYSTAQRNNIRTSIAEMGAEIKDHTNTVKSKGACEIERLNSQILYSRLSIAS